MKCSMAPRRAAFFASGEMPGDDEEILKTNVGSDPADSWNTLFLAADHSFFDAFAGGRDTDARVEFSISGKGALSLCAVGLNVGAGAGGGVSLKPWFTNEGAAEAGEDENEGTGLAGDEISGTLKAGALKGSGSLGIGREVSPFEGSGAGGGVTDRVRLGAGDSSMSSSTPLTSRSGEED